MSSSAYDKIINICLVEKVAIRQSQAAAEYDFQKISGDEHANTLSQQPALQRVQRQLSEQECYPFLIVESLVLLSVNLLRVWFTIFADIPSNTHPYD
jgi:hypothetical protein